MMNYLGTTLSFPIRVDSRGSLTTTKSDDEIIEQSIIDVIETGLFERKMLPTYGLKDEIFDVLDRSFAARLAFFVEEQITNYVTAVQNVKAEVGILENDQFAQTLPPANKAMIRIIYIKRGSAIPQELIYPTWRFANAN